MIHFVHFQTWCTEKNLPSLVLFDELLLEVSWRNHGQGEIGYEYTESNIVLCEMEYGRFSYGLMSMVCVKRCLVTRMVYMGTRHSLQGEAGDSIL